MTSQELVAKPPTMNVEILLYAVAAIIGIPFLVLWLLATRECLVESKWPLVLPVWFLILPMYTAVGKSYCRYAGALSVVAVLLAMLARLLY